MKKIINLLFIALLGVFVFNACVDNTFDEPDFPFEDPDITGNVTIKQFKAKFGKLERPVKIEDSIIFSAIVIANDSLGNFYKKIIVQDETGGIEILIDGRNLYGIFPIGRKIFVNAKGMVIGKDHGSTQLGGLLSEGQLISLPYKDIDTYIQRGSLHNRIELREKSFESFSEDDVNTLVKFSNMQFSKEVLGLTFADDTAKSDKNRAINNCSCNNFVIRTSGYSEFASEKLPEGNGDIVCVLGVYSYNDGALAKSDFQGYIRSLDDIHFDNERCTGDYTSFDDWETNMLSFGWTMKIVEGEAKWEFSSYKGRKYVQISNYIDGQRAASDAWLISGQVDLSNMDSPKLNFFNASNYNGDDLQVFVSSTYDGESVPNINEWKQYGIKNLSQGDYNWVNSGCIPLEDYIGQKVYIGFRYIGNTDDGKTWEIDDICISDGECLKEPDKFNKDFEDGSLYSGGWESKVLVGSTNWTVETRSGQTYGKISNYKNGSKSESDALFISPKVNLGIFEKPALSFRNTFNYTGPDLEIYISNSYNGVLNNLSNWTRLNANLSSGGWEWVESGDISLEDFEGQDINIAFRYQGTNSEGSTWEIDDIVLKEYEGGGTSTGGFSDDFEGGNLDKWTVVSVSGDQKWVYSNKYGNPKSCAKVSGYYNSNRYANDDWLITPQIDLAGNNSAKLTFDNATKYTGPAMQVYISSGSNDPAVTSDWVELTYTKSEGNWAWTTASVDLSSYADKKIYIGFRYTSTDSETATWEIDNVVIK